MVPYIDKVIGSTTNPPSQEQEQCNSTIQTREKTPIGEETEADGLSLIRRSLSNRGISPETQATILNSWRSGAQKQYQVFLNKWQSYADQRDADPLYPTMNQVLDFLQELYQQELSYSGINTARSTLSAFIVLEGTFTVGMHPMVQRFMKGFFQARPALPMYRATPDTSVVLAYCT